MDNEKTGIHHCNICQKRFTRKFTLSRHKVNCHGITLEKKFVSRSSRIKCTLCSEVFSKISELNTHLHIEHNQELKVEEYDFNNKAEFEEWKESVEKSSCSYYVKARNFNRKNLKTSYYDCHRSGFYERQGHLRAPKMKGTNRINGTCPARIKLIENSEDGKQKVIFISTHVGHNPDADRLRLTKQERLELMSKLEQGISKDEILSAIKNNFTPTARLSYLTRHDLNNLTSSFHLKSETKIEAEDARSVADWVSKCEFGDLSPILAFKAAGEINSRYENVATNEFLLAFANDCQLDILKLYGNDTIIVDSQRRMNVYGLCLTTLIVINEWGELIPVAFMFHTNISEEMYKLFFSRLRDKVTLLQPRTFISEDDLSYNSWGSVFDFPDRKLLSFWNVKRGFDHMTSAKISDVKKRNEHRQLLHLLHEECEASVFEDSINSALNQWINNRKNKKFAKCFQNKYASNVKEWAFCYRDEVLKTIDLEYEKWRDITFKNWSCSNSRLGFALEECLCVARTAFLRATRTNLPTKRSSIRKNHRFSLEMKNQDVQILENNKWLISESSPNNNNKGEVAKVYKVELNDPISLCDSCTLNCEDCKTCIHALSCTCFEYLIKFDMCKHIHLVCQMFHLVTSQSTVQVLDSEQNLMEEDIVIIRLEGENVIEQDERVVIYEEVCSVEETKQQIHREIDELHTLVDNCSNIDQLNLFYREFISLRASLQKKINRVPLTQFSEQNIIC